MAWKRLSRYSEHAMYNVPRHSAASWLTTSPVDCLQRVVGLIECLRDSFEIAATDYSIHFASRMDVCDLAAFELGCIIKRLEAE